MGAKCLGLLHVLGHHLQPGLGLQQAEELWRDVVLHLPPVGSPRSGSVGPKSYGTRVSPPLLSPAIRGGEVVVVLGSVLEGGQLGHMREVLVSRPRWRQDSEQPLEVVREHLVGEDRAQGHGLGIRHALRETGSWPWGRLMGWPDLVVVDGDVELVVELEGLAPDHAAAPEGVAGVPELRLCCHIQDVFPAGQWPHALPCDTQESGHHTTLHGCPILSCPVPSVLTSVGHHKEDVFLQSLWILQPHLTAQLLNHIQSHLGTGTGGCDTATSPCCALGHQLVLSIEAHPNDDPLFPEDKVPQQGQPKGAAPSHPHPLGAHN